MMLVRVKNMVKSIGIRDLFSIEEISIYEGNRIGLIGKNGTGKSTLLSMLSERVEEGSAACIGSLGYVKQLPEDNGRHLSGGERTLVQLQEVFGLPHSVLLLDEPTNNLDWKRIEWLEKQLLAFKGGMIISSHDRELLDRVCTEIWELENGKLTVYGGNYTYYEERKELEKQQYQFKYEQYMDEKRRLSDLYRRKKQQSESMDRPPSRMGSSEWRLHKDKAAGKRKKVERVSKVISEKLERLEKVEKPFDWNEVKMEMALQQPLHAKQAVVLKKLSKAFGRRLLYEIEYAKVKTGSKTALLGDNGTGKTTLLHQILSGEDGAEVAPLAKIGVLHQQLNAMPTEKTVLEYVKQGSTKPEHLIRIILGRLHFYEEAVHKSISVLSGGEKAKAGIAKLLASDCNMLCLDEPTNHLDIEAMQALETLLQEFEGTVLFISHDRRFVSNVADALLLIENQKVVSFTGSYGQYKESQKNSAAVSVEREEKMILENRLANVIGKLSMPEFSHEKEKWEQEYEHLLSRLKELMKW